MTARIGDIRQKIKVHINDRFIIFDEESKMSARQIRV